MFVEIVQPIYLEDVIDLKTSVWDKKANKGEGGYIFGSIRVSREINTMIKIIVKGDELFCKRVKVSKVNEKT